MKRHILKTIQPFFEDLYTGKKVFELRKDDRDIQVGDWIDCVEYDPKEDIFSGRAVKAQISYILRNAPQYGLADGCCILSFGNVEATPSNTLSKEPFDGFYKRLLMFVENVQVNDQMSEEEKDMIIAVCKRNIK